MNMRNIYLLVPVDYSQPVKEQIQIDKIQMHVGRGTSLEAARQKLERELNGGRTMTELFAAASQAKTPEATAAFANGIRVLSDTLYSWNGYVGSEAWPIQKEVDAYVDANS